MPQPQLMIVAGPNGSGKTTLTNKLRESNIDLGIYINADEIATGLSGDALEVSRKAQQIADKMREDCLNSGQNFTFETVMSHPSKIELMSRARNLGYCVSLYFVSTDSREINVHRVASRVAQGGHDVPLDKIKARYDRTLNFLKDAVENSDRGALFDNTAPKVEGGYLINRPMQMILSYELKDGKILPTIKNGPVPDWVMTYFLKYFWIGNQ